MKIGDHITITSPGSSNKIGRILTIIESINNRKMYLVMLEDYPIGIWFFEEINSEKNIPSIEGMCIKKINVNFNKI
ncbi:hypothetical protein [Candidatus Pantoea edessiphila]|uniref:hypothetical protein n=1 Tax=Candidatus Pantoea edessiphila TaxID=2044610 RepID=UPI00109C71EF|nr:hypothetical protein [Candidatus Pantoea edessiphila]